VILCCYLVIAVGLTWQLWADPASRAQIGDPEDVDQFAFFMRYSATAVAHGHLPALVTTAMNAPRGINMMWNTSFLLPGIVMSPVTLLAGPQVSLTIVLTAGFAGSAASLFWVLRRWGAGLWPAALGGALYGFSPAVLDSAFGHYNFAFAVTPPLIIDAVLRLVTGRGRPARVGIWLGLLVAAQLFIAEEVVADTAVAAAIIVALLAATHRHAVRERVRDMASGLGVSAVVVLAISGYALGVQFAGPLTQRGSPWNSNGYTSHLGTFVNPPATVLFHTGASPSPAGPAASGPTYIPEYLAYLGWPLLVLLAFAAIRYWRDPRVRTAAVTFAVLELFSLGGQSRRFLGIVYPGGLLPWHWLQALPLVGSILPDRFAILADGAAAAVLAYSLHLALSAARERPGRARRYWPGAVAVLALLPLIPLPVQASPVSKVPAGWQAAFARLDLAANARVLIVPVPYSHRPEPLRWQAATGQPGSFEGGWFVGPSPNGQANVEYFGPARIHTLFLYLDALWAGTPPGPAPGPAQIRADLRYLRPAAVVAVTGRDSAIGRYLAGLFGRPTFGVGQVLVWRLG
jgi:dolichyl-phosphate beta-glucosyltransferase